MNSVSSRTIGWQALLVGVTGLLAVLTLVLFFVGLFQDMQALSSMGSINDASNALVGLLSAVLASMLHSLLSKLLSARSSWALLIVLWLGALAVSFGSWLIITGRADVERSSYYFFFGNGLIGIWLWVINGMARRQALWPSGITRLGLFASSFMAVGLLGLYGIVSGSDRSDYSPLLLISGISFLGIGILYPLWALRLGHWILWRQEDRAAPGEVRGAVR